jgi:spore coat protein U-like protein
MQKKYHIQLICLGLSISLLAFMPRVMAQDGTLLASGQITTSTCVVSVTNPGESALSGSTSKTLSLGNYSPLTASTAQFDQIGDFKAVVFSLSNGKGQACSTFLNSFWDLSIQLGTQQIVEIPDAGGKIISLLKNSIAVSSGGTDVAVQLISGIYSTPAILDTPTIFEPYLKANSANNYLSHDAAGPFTAQSGSSILLGAAFINTTGATPKAGRYSQTLPLTLVYK